MDIQCEMRRVFLDTRRKTFGQGRSDLVVCGVEAWFPDKPSGPPPQIHLRAATQKQLDSEAEWPINTWSFYPHFSEAELIRESILLLDGLDLEKLYWDERSAGKSA